MEKATLGGGCFWCLEAVFLGMKGVAAVTSGYAGGHVANPSYEEVCGKRTGHAEVVQVSYDPAMISFRDLLKVFFTIHDPTTKDRQGADIGPQYRSIILTHDDAQATTAREVMAELTAARLWGNPIVTEIVPLTQFWPAEPEHHNYFARNPWSGYCQAVVAPKVLKFRKNFANLLKPDQGA
ncbi:MAG: peptide-methionine (S)-S-oxide reductase MsrA [Roseomonas sp.]|nr:peptide-methionine (S)-S-oxide reductase MsrA [Roseomonas sp.]MCA3328531.1 peptide-methionine (S)-S-oxide reductase MsrA [Roseomonas sp.]MCA3330031.1 peptide-methionine (S)-S-oxide reductase MsrA [Roseomonas sp.]MCA3333693.1 peptide-methionine (S)-S-oxide reductase MsrA [Roseomonas sp.]MCA3346153.1 peptide-methionine (S)-S-oxide reductase MsrA [Roseomonas sp.]